MIRPVLLLASFTAFLLIGCGGNQRPSTTTTPEATRMVATVTDAGSRIAPSPSPTEPSVAPAPTITPIPTSTPSPSPTATGETRVRLEKATDFGESRNPLTGERVEDARLLDRRPIAVKVSNAPPGWVRPQSGLSQADLVFEHVTEGPITRFTAILYGAAPPKIGSIRSARLIDIQLLTMYDAALAFSGSSIGLSRRLFGSELKDRILRTKEDGYYRADEDKPYEHRLYADPERLWGVLSERGLNRGPQLEGHMAFDTRLPDGGQSVGEATVRYKDWTEVTWRFDTDGSRFKRWVDGEPHLDANHGGQIQAANVVILFVEHKQEPTICELQRGDQCLAYGTDVDLLGAGEAILLRDGLRYSAQWRRESPGQMLSLWYADSRPLPLQIGKTWFQVMPNDYEDPVSFTR